LCGTESSGESCFQYQIGQCAGAYLGNENPENYNEKAELAAQAFERIFEDDMLLVGKGRTPTEQSVVLVENNQFGGFGYANKEDIRSIEDLKSAVKSYAHHADYLEIIQGFLKKGKEVKIVKL